MSLYDRRNYADGYELSDASLEQGRISQTIKQTYALLTASMIAAAAGAFVAMSFGVSLAIHPFLSSAFNGANFWYASSCKSRR